MSDRASELVAWFMAEDRDPDSAPFRSRVAELAALGDLGRRAMELVHVWEDDESRRHQAMVDSVERDRLAQLSLPQLAAEIAAGADLDLVRLDDALYRYLATNGDAIARSAIDRLCQSGARAWFDANAPAVLADLAGELAATGDTYWFEIELRSARANLLPADRRARLLARLRAELRDPWLGHVVQGLKWAAVMRDPALVPDIVATFSRDDWFNSHTERLEACQQIGAPAREALEQLLFSSRDPDIRGPVANTLGGIGDPASTEALLSAAEDPEPPVRAGAIWSLNQIAMRAPSPAITAAQLRAIADPHPDVRARGEQGLRHSDDPLAQAAVAKYRADQNL